ncbi:NACHT domain-containing protein [Enteroscipio rubneri]|uniref:NACHT domain-containing protein n=1 Tax=Enteroscipio rubneri TaxID=2070686 RepID=UPI003AF1DE7C
MTYFSGDRLDYGKFIQRMTIDAVGTDYIESKSLEGYDGITIGRTFFHDCLPKRTYLGARQFDKKILRLYEVILERGCSLWDQGKHFSKTREELSVSLIEMMQEMPALSALLDLDSLVIAQSDNEDVAKSKRDELVGLLGLMLSCMPHEGDGIDVPVLNKALRRTLSKRIDSFPIAGSRKVFVQLREAIRRHNKRAERSSGTYRLEEIVQGLFPGIVEEEHCSLFELDGQVSPLVQLIRSTWRASGWRNLMLVGEGGIGKTVAMLDAAKALSKKGTAAVYIPLHMLPFYNFPGSFIRTYIERTVLRGNSNLWSDLEALISEECVNNVPRLVLLLDGWNEISEKRINASWLSDILKEEIETAIEPCSGIQVVIAGRARMDSSTSWYRPWAYSKVQRLNRDRIVGYLNSCKVGIPEQDDPIWDVISNPLMLTLFSCCEAQHENCFRNRCCSFIGGDRARSQSAIIWNFLQCQINKAMLVNKQRGAAFPDILAINYAAAYIGWEMESARVFRISKSHLRKLVEEAGEHFASTWRESYYVSVARQETQSRRVEWCVEDIEDALLIGVGLMFGDEGGATPEEFQDGAEDGRVVGFLHQKFRDFYAALYMRDELHPFGQLFVPEESDAWAGKAVSGEVLDMLAVLVDDGLFESLWDAMREVEVRKDSATVFHLLEIASRNELDIEALGFRGIDLRYTMLQNREISCEGCDFRSAKISNTTFIPIGHTESVSSVEWISDGVGVDGDFMATFGRTAVVWDRRSGTAVHEFVNEKMIPYDVMAVSLDGSLLAMSAKGYGLDVFAIDSGERRAVLPSSMPRVGAMAFLGGDRFLAYAIDEELTLLDLKSLEKRVLDLPEEIFGSYRGQTICRLHCSRTGAVLAAMYDGGGVTCWTLDPVDPLCDPRFRSATSLFDGIADLQLSEDGGRMMILTLDDGLYESDSDELVEWEDRSIDLGAGDAVGFSYQHGMIAIADENIMRIYSIMDGSLLKEFIMVPLLVEAPDEVSVIEFSPSGDKVMCIHENNAITVWDARPSFSPDERPVLSVDNKKNAIGHIAALSSRSLASVTGNGYFVTWDVGSMSIDGIIRPGQDFPDYWDVNDGPTWVLAYSNKIKVVSSSRLFEREFKNRFHSIQISEDSSYALALDNDPSLWCLSIGDLHSVAQIAMDCEPVAVSTVSEDLVLGLTAEGYVICWSIPDLSEQWRASIWGLLSSSDCDSIQEIAREFCGEDDEPYIASPEYARLDCCEFDGSRLALLAFEAVSFESDDIFQMIVKLDIDSCEVLGVSVEDGGDELMGLCAMPETGRFFISSAKGWLESRDLETFESIQCAEPISGVVLIGADFEGARFENETLAEMVRASGARNVGLP